MSESSAKIAGYATPEGTLRFAERFPDLQQFQNFRQPSNVPGAKDLWFSTLGLGSYLGETDDAADQLYAQAVVTAVRNGFNVFDTAINYRHQRSERSIGAGIRELILERDFHRNEIVVCSKAGYLSFDGEVPAEPRSYFTHEYVDSGIIKPTDVAGGMHCMAPAYLLNQLERSRANLGLETIDVYYVHNPESELGDVSREVFQARLKAAFAALEQAVSDGKIRFYGIASWNALRVQQGEQAYISLSDCVSAAREAGGEHHHFRFIQLPFNLAMAEGYGLPAQALGREQLSPLQFAAQEGLAAIGSASLYQGQLTRNLPPNLRALLNAETDAQCAMQFARSAPGLLTSLIGMGRPAHVLENAAVLHRNMIPQEEWESLFRNNA